MGRVGIEPTTLGLRVRPDELQRTAGNGIALQTDASRRPADGDELQPTEPFPYAHPYAHAVFSETGDDCNQEFALAKGVRARLSCASFDGDGQPEGPLLGVSVIDGLEGGLAVYLGNEPFAATASVSASSFQGCLPRCPGTRFQFGSGRTRPEG